MVIYFIGIKVRKTVKNELLQQNVVLSEEDLEIIRRIEGQFYPDVDYNPYEVRSIN